MMMMQLPALSKLMQLILGLPENWFLGQHPVYFEFERYIFEHFSG